MARWPTCTLAIAGGRFKNPRIKYYKGLYKPGSHKDELTPFRREKIRSLYKRGFTLKEISEQTGLNITGVLHYVKDISRGKGAPLKKLEGKKLEAYKMLKKKMKPRHVADKLGLSKREVYTLAMMLKNRGKKK